MTVPWSRIARAASEVVVAFLAAEAIVALCRAVSVNPLTRIGTPEMREALLQAVAHAMLGRPLASARLFYERAANAREAIAALRMGETFDPMFLGFAHLSGVPGNLETAVSWYRRARDLGSGEAAILLQKLEAK